MVVHFDPAGESKSYLHRSGRTARAGASGAVVTVASMGQARHLGELFRRAGVEAKNVDARTVDGPMTPEALADAPAMAAPAAPTRSKSGSRGGPRRSGGFRGNGGDRRGGGHGAGGYGGSGRSTSRGRRYGS
jgi:superfamily II DNA/RNA helicase